MYNTSTSALLDKKSEAQPVVNSTYSLYNCKTVCILIIFTIVRYKTDIYDKKQLQ